jgi:hypothetical protein
MPDMRWGQSTRLFSLLFSFLQVSISSITGPRRFRW